MQLISSWRHCMSHTPGNLAPTATIQVHWVASYLLQPVPPVLLCLIQLILDGVFPTFPVLTDQPGSLACHPDPCCASVPSHLDFIAVLTLCLIAMSLDPKTVSSLSPAAMAPWSTVIPVLCPLPCHQQPSKNTICLHISSYSGSLLQYLLSSAVH